MRSFKGVYWKNPYCLENDVSHTFYTQNIIRDVFPPNTMMQCIASGAWGELVSEMTPTLSQMRTFAPTGNTFTHLHVRTSTMYSIINETKKMPLDNPGCFSLKYRFAIMLLTFCGCWHEDYANETCIMGCSMSIILWMLETWARKIEFLMRAYVLLNRSKNMLTKTTRSSYNIRKRTNVCVLCAILRRI